MTRTVLAAVALLAAAVASGVVAPAPARAKPYVFALVPKATNNPFYDQARDGCKKAEAESKGAFQCLYIGPSEHGGGDEQVQIVEDLVAKHVDGIAVSPANAAAMARALEVAKKAGIPVLTWDSDVLPKDHDLRIAYIGTHNYDIGVDLAKRVLELKPKGGTICIQTGGAAAENLNERTQGIRDTLSGQKSSEAPGVRLTGQNGWTEVDGCPLYTNDDFPLALQQMQDILNKYPKLDAFVPNAGFPQFGGALAYKRVVQKIKSRLQDGSLALVIGDSLPMQVELMKQGLSDGQVGQKPYDMGYDVMGAFYAMKQGKPAPKDPTYTGLTDCTPKNADTCLGGSN
ncbi:MAG TPA: substrate-binding domain-containing protein [Roseiarcus sp.]|nr:substrate-binding domain-containing protein [Roseiarcus sp.]